MSDIHHVAVYLCCAVLAVLLFAQDTEASFRAGKANVATESTRLFACQNISFATPFYGGDEITVLATVGRSIKSPTRGNGGAIWVESVDNSGFKACILEYSDGSNNTAEVNWIAIQSAPSGAKKGTATLNDWSTGTTCKWINLQQPFLSPPVILVTPSHQSPERPQDAMAVWMEDSREDSFKICFKESKIFDGVHKNIKVNWMAYTEASLYNFTLMESFVFANNTTQQENLAFCQTVNFTNPFFAPPVVVLTPKRCYHRHVSSLRPSCDAVTAWVEFTSTKDMEICIKSYNSDESIKNIITVDYLVIGDLDPCIEVTCGQYGHCKAIGPHDARCVCVNSCPSYQEPVCSSNGTTYDNKCLFEQEMCFLQLNFTIQHPGSCEGFSLQHGRRSMPHTPSLGYSFCQVIRLEPFIFYPDKPIEAQITVNHQDTSDMSYVHDASVSWVENVNNDKFTACVMTAGFNERMSYSNVTVDWLAYQGAPVGGVAGVRRISQWWTGTTCQTVNFPSGKFSKTPLVFVTIAHHHAGLKRDAASVWLEDITTSSCKICLRELQNYAGSHEDIYVNWLAFSTSQKPLFSEQNSVYFANSNNPPPDFNNAFCKDIYFRKVYQNIPNVFVSANHSSTGGNLDPMHNSITAWVEYISTTGARVCLKEFYESRYDPLSIQYMVLSDVCKPGWSYFSGYCYIASQACATWLTAVSNCSTLSSSLVTIHNQQENVYIQHRHNGQKSWIGLNDRSVEGSFVWTNNELNSFRFWARNQPNSLKNEDCVHTLGSRQGYTWDDVPCDNCYNFTCFKDLDECASDDHDCNVNAVCQNTPGSYTCSCEAGYTGNGRTCVDIDECASDDHDCDVNAVCQNTLGSYTCSCEAGYTGNGRTCVYVGCQPVGVADPIKIPDAQMTATGYWSASYYPYYGRLNETRGAGGWCSRTKQGPRTAYLQVDMGTIRSVCAVATQGANVYNEWTTSYVLRMSTDGITWNPYEENNAEKVFLGNTDRQTIVKHSFPTAVEARFVRFYYVTCYSWPCIRVEIYV